MQGRVPADKMVSGSEGYVSKLFDTTHIIWMNMKVNLFFDKVNIADYDRQSIITH